MESGGCREAMLTVKGAARLLHEAGAEGLQEYPKMIRKSRIRQPQKLHKEAKTTR